MNIWQVSGHIGKDIKFDKTSKGTSRVKFSLCFKNPGKEGDKTNKNWLKHCIAYKGTADIIHNHLGTGDRVLFSGEIDHVVFKTPEGNTVDYLQYIIHYIEFIDTKRKDKDTQEYNYDEMPVFSENTTKNPDVKSPFL